MGETGWEVPWFSQHNKIPDAVCVSVGPQKKFQECQKPYEYLLQLIFDFSDRRFSYLILKQAASPSICATPTENERYLLRGISLLLFIPGTWASLTGQHVLPISCCSWRAVQI